MAQEFPSADIWRVAEALRPDSEVRLGLSDGTVVTGRVVAVQSDAIALSDLQIPPGGLKRLSDATVSGGLAFRRSEIQSVEVLRLSDRDRRQAVAHTLDELKAIVPKGERLWIKDRSGRETSGQLDQIDATSVVLADRGKRTVVMQSEVDEIQARRGRDPLWNGAVFGAAALIPLGIAGHVAGSIACNEGGDGSCWQPSALLIGWPAIGALIGISVDRGKSRAMKSIYRAGEERLTDVHKPAWNVAPVVGRNSTGITLALSY